MTALLTDIDPDGLLEYSVVFTDRSLNHMSNQFQRVMREISATLKQVYQADAMAIIPGSGTYGMEAVARQLASDKKCLIIRNGWFSYRWSQILDMGRITSDSKVLTASPVSSDTQAAYEPPAIDDVVDSIRTEKPGIVFAPHVETSSGLMLPDNYIKEITEAVHEVNGLMVLDCIASGTVWIDMRNLGVDVLISAPQKGWSASPCCALVMLSDSALIRIDESTSSSFACDLKKWLNIMQTYEQGKYAYHATMPTDALNYFYKAMKEADLYGFNELKNQQIMLGQKVRTLFDEKGFNSVAAKGFEAPGVVVYYTNDPLLHSGQKFSQLGIQIAAGVPLQCGERSDFQTFRIGLFGLDKLQNIDRTVATLEDALDSIHSH